MRALTKIIVLGPRGVQIVFVLGNWLIHDLYHYDLGVNGNSLVIRKNSNLIL